MTGIYDTGQTREPGREIEQTRWILGSKRVYLVRNSLGDKPQSMLTTPRRERFRPHILVLRTSRVWIRMSHTQIRRKMNDRKGPAANSPKVQRIGVIRAILDVSIFGAVGGRL